MRHRVLSTVVPLRVLGAVLLGSVTFGTIAHAWVTDLPICSERQSRGERPS